MGSSKRVLHVCSSPPSKSVAQTLRVASTYGQLEALVAAVAAIPRGPNGVQVRPTPLRPGDNLGSKVVFPASDVWII
jgi:hypothetical protein